MKVFLNKVFLLLLGTYIVFQLMIYSSSYENQGYRLIGEFGEIMKEKYGMQLTGFGGGADNQQFNLLCATLILNQTLSFEEGRKLLIDCINEFLHQANDNPQFRPYIKWPITAKNLNLIIICQENEDKELYYPYVNSMACIEGTMKYAFCYKTENGDKFEIYKETYEEAVAILQQNKMNSN